ncbi:hypothetical protein, partial [Methylophaga muralis]|uniref:hypothetical protein n=1 Tax=Methylophaga muralis TaxID=291169 RepID=UPI000A98E268
MENGDLILIKTGSSWTKYDVAKQNVASDFNKLNTQISSYSQQQCAGENLTWVPSAVTEPKPSENTAVTEFTNTNDIAVAKAEIVESNNAPTTTYSAESTQGSSTSSSTGGKKSSGGSSSGGSSTNSNSSPSDNLQIGANQSTENTRTLQQKQNTSSVKNNTDITQDIITEPGTSETGSALPETEQESVFEPNIPEEIIADIGNEQTIP